MLPASEKILSVLARYFDDPAKCESIVNELSQLAETAEVPGAAIDLARKERCGFPEVIYAEGKPAELIVEILKRQRTANQPGFATRVSAEQSQQILKELPDAIYHPSARTLRLPLPVDTAASADTQATSALPQVAVVSAGSCYAAVAQEAIETLRWMNIPAVLIEDVGVAGPQRLLKHVPLLQTMQVVVCVAGMEAALPSVLGGHVSCPVIGVPTSVGYGASLGGITALLSMLTCCASNVVAVNIDAGFRGGYVAGMIVQGNSARGEASNAKAHSDV